MTGILKIERDPKLDKPWEYRGVTTETDDGGQHEPIDVIAVPTRPLPITRSTSILHQDEWWIDGSGNRLRLEEIGRGHRANLMRWLDRKAPALVTAAHVEAIYGPFAPRGSMAILDVERIFEEAARDPVAWVRGTRLYRRLKELSARPNPLQAAPTDDLF